MVVPFPGFPSGSESAWQCRRCFCNVWVRKIPWRTKWQSTPVLLTGKSHVQRNPAGYSPWGHKESDRTQQLSMPTRCHSLRQGSLKQKQWESKSFYSQFNFEVASTSATSTVANLYNSYVKLNDIKEMTYSGIEEIALRWRST